MYDFVNIQLYLYLCVAFSYLSMCNALQNCYTVIQYAYITAFVCYIPPRPPKTNTNYSRHLSYTR